SALLQKNENMKTEIQEVLNQWASYKVASSLIERTLKYAKKDRLPVTLEDTEEYFELLTGGEYTAVDLEEDALLVRRKDGTTFHPAELSRGTAEQLYVALRFAFVKNIAEKLPLPMVIDDGFVNFDEIRKQEVWRLLESLSQSVQVLYFTFDNPRSPQFKNSNR